ncbi:F-box/LRR-repeat protein 13-like [Vigna radiata var. radiata]|uniref:F-box/LRR-repeat protein 13-like n=1 Tax=Vigna radiata var. radiata TaxID=3916 RepID=A0A1S3TDX5_VIGRR|nr:F-box/LRR-repeat protein 13-like [Vigna radiata var. radiata]
MDDRMSSLADEILCYILSLLPTEQVIATSVLSKRWNLLWRSVPSLDFDTDNEDFWSLSEKTFNMFYSSVCSFLIDRGDQPLHRFRLRSNFFCDDSKRFNKLIKDIVSKSDKLQLLDLFALSNTLVPSVVFSFKTLVVLKLEAIPVEEVFFVDLPFLKILHLIHITFSIDIDLSQLLSGCPNLEDLKFKGLTCKTKGKFNRLPKLVRASIRFSCRYFHHI